MAASLLSSPCYYLLGTLIIMSLCIYTSIPRYLLFSMPLCLKRSLSCPTPPLCLSELPCCLLSMLRPVPLAYPMLLSSLGVTMICLLSATVTLFHLLSFYVHLSIYHFLPRSLGMLSGACHQQLHHSFCADYINHFHSQTVK